MANPNFFKSNLQFLKKSFAILLIALIALGNPLLLITPKIAGASPSHSWIQTDWGGGATTTPALHPVNQTGWANFFSQEPGLAPPGPDLALTPTATDFVSESTALDFTRGSFTNTRMLGQGVPTRVQLSDNSLGQISSGAGHAVAIRRDGTLWSWGRNVEGQLGLGDTATRTTPVRVGVLDDWHQLSASGSGWHTLAMRRDGTLWAWGWNGLGQLGIGTTTNQLSPVQVGSLSDWVQVEAGREYTLAIRRDGTLWAWGLNSSGQLGIGTTTNQLSPVQVGSLTDWAHVSAGSEHALALRRDGTLWAWGLNSSGQLGIGTTTNQLSPVQVGTSTNWVRAEVGDNHSLALKRDGTLWSWGLNNSGQLGLGDTANRNVPLQIGTVIDWDSVSAGGSHTLALRRDGSLWSWGWNGNGQLGLGDFSNRHNPVQIGPLTDWQQVNVGREHTFAMRSGGTLWGWGRNIEGQLGLDDFINRNTPTQVGTSTDWIEVRHHLSGSFISSKIDTINILEFTTLDFTITQPPGTTIRFQLRSATTSAGLLTAPWSGPDGAPTTFYATSGTAIHPMHHGNRWIQYQAFLSTTNDLVTPTLEDITIRYRRTVVGIVHATFGDFALGVFASTTAAGAHSFAKVELEDNSLGQIIAGREYTLAIRRDGTLWAWGLNSSGQLGIGTTTNQLSPVQVGTSTDWLQVSAGWGHAVGLRRDGTLWAWGANGWGQLGIGSTATQLSPVQVGTSTDWIQISAGGDHTLALRRDGTLWAWGLNSSGQLGLGDTAMRTIPTQVVTLTDLVQISTRRDHSLGLRRDGTLWAWGRNTEGQLGLGDTSMRTLPSQIGVLTDWSQVSAGWGHAVGLRRDGTLWAWGRNVEGQLGLGDTVMRTLPAQVGISVDWAQVSAGGYHTVALRRDRILWAWGLNSVGQLGLGDIISRNLPFQVRLSADWHNITAGGWHTILIRRDGTLWASGWGESGQLGLGDSLNRSTPTQAGTSTDWIQARHHLSGSFISSKIDTINIPEFTTLDFTITQPPGTTIRFQLRSATTSVGLLTAPWSGPDGTSTTFYTVSGTAIHPMHHGNRWIQYQAFLSTTNDLLTPTLEDITIRFIRSSELISSPFNTGDPRARLNRISWSQTLPVGTLIRFQVRTAPDDTITPGSPGSWTPWSGPDDGITNSFSTTTFFTDHTGLELIDADLRDGSHDQWIQYRVWLRIINPALTPILHDVSLAYDFFVPVVITPTPTPEPVWIIPGQRRRFVPPPPIVATPDTAIPAPALTPQEREERIAFLRQELQRLLQEIILLLQRELNELQARRGQ